MNSLSTASEPDEKPANQISNPDSVEDIDAMLMRGVAVLHASGRLRYEDDELDRALVLEILSAVMPVPHSG